MELSKYLPKVNNSLIGENSPNLVTLALGEIKRRLFTTILKRVASAAIVKERDTTGLECTKICYLLSPLFRCADN
jgi:hypothetical protein